MPKQNKCYQCTGIILGFIFMMTGIAGAQDPGRLKLIRLQGSYFEIGQSWGKAAKADLKTSIDHELGWIAQYISRDKKDLIAMSNKLIPIVKEYDPRFIDVLKGMAEGSGLPFEEIFALRSLLELMFYCHKLPAMCTSFAVTGRAAKDGSTVISGDDGRRG